MELQRALADFYVSRSRFQGEITITNELEVAITAIAERIRFFRKERRMTQTQLGMLLGFPKKSANVRLAQYETGARTPKNGLVTEMAQVLSVSPQALTVPDIDSDIGLMHTLFALEDRYGLTISETGGDVCLQVDENQGTDAVRLCKMLRSWNQAAAMLKAGEVSSEDYDHWRYCYPLVQLRD